MHSSNIVFEIFARPASLVVSIRCVAIRENRKKNDPPLKVSVAVVSPKRERMHAYRHTWTRIKMVSQ